MDVCKIANKFIALYPNRSANNTLDFLDKVTKEMPFTIQRIQTDRGQEFFAYSVQEKLMKHKIKFRPIKPASPHLNGKVERTQRTDLDEFYSSVNIKSPDLVQKLETWQEYYNKQRAHSSLQGQTSHEKYKKLESKIPSLEEVNQNFDLKKEVIITQDYKIYKMIKATQKVV